MYSCINIDQSFMNIDKLYHFTTFENLVKILKSGVLFMNPLSKNLNDKKEESYLSNYAKGKLFITCFTSEMNEKFWISEDYAKGIKNGVSICFNVKELLNITIKTSSKVKLELSDRSIFNYDSYENESDYRIRNLVFKKVIYKDDPMKYYIFDNDTYNYFINCCNVDKINLENYCKTILNMGFVKTKIDKNGNDQSYEKEYRILVRILHKGSELKWQVNNKEFPENMFNRLYIDITQMINSLIIFVKKEFSNFEALEELSKKYGFSYVVI